MEVSVIGTSQAYVGRASLAYMELGFLNQTAQGFSRTTRICFGHSRRWRTDGVRFSLNAVHTEVPRSGNVSSDVSNPARRSKPPSIDHAVDDDNPSNVEAAEMESLDISNSGFSTLKARRFRIPEIQTCPPAPKKRRPNFSLRRSPIAFFAPPDLELFFFIALGDVLV